MPAPKHNRNAQLAESAAGCWLQVRITPQMRARWLLAAKSAGLRLSPWVRRMLERGADREKIPPVKN